MEASSTSEKRLLLDYSDEEKSSFQLFGQLKKRTATTKFMYLTIACLIASNIFLLHYYRRPSVEQCQAPSKFGMQYLILKT